MPLGQRSTATASRTATRGCSVTLYHNGDGVKETSNFALYKNVEKTSILYDPDMRQVEFIATVEGAREKITWNGLFRVKEPA